MIERQTNADFINRVVNHESVYPHVKGKHEGPFDLSPVVAQNAHVILCGEHGGVIFIKHGGGYYEAHTAVLPEGRGKWTMQMARETLRWMFTKTDAVEIVTKCPQGNLAAVAGARAIGAHCEWTTRSIWPTISGLVPVDVYVITLQEWASKNRQMLEYAGRAFHDWLKAQGVDEDHPDDPVHDAYVGFAVEMIEAGQVIKGVNFYNRWAIMSDYRPISVPCQSPMTLDIGTATLVLGSNGWRATCQRAD